MTGEVTEKNFIQHELIGLEASIIGSTDNNLLNRTGIIVDETMNTFKFEFDDSGKKSCVTVQKHRNTFKFSIPKERNAAFSNTEYVIINGSDLTKRPEDRIKKLAKLVNRIHK